MADLENNIQSEELMIDIYDIIRDLIKDWWLVVLIALTTAMCTYIVSDYLYKPQYTANATFVVTSKGANDNYTNLDSAYAVASSLTKIFDSEIMKKKVAMDIGAVGMPDYITAKVIPETNLFELEVSAPNPKVTYQIIKSIINNYTSVTSYVYENAILDVLKAPEIPEYPDNPQDLEGALKLGLWVGLAAATMLLIALSIMRDNVKSEREIVKKLDTKLFSVIYHENKYKTLRSRLFKTKKSILITSPTVSFAFVESIKKMRAKFEYKVSNKGYNVLLVTSVLENEGKSTVATNLALALAQKSKNVLLIDADFSKPSVYKILQKNVQSHQEIGECIIKKSDIKEALTFDEESGLYLLIGSKLYKNSTEIIAREAFEKLVKISKKVMDYIIIDAPPISVSADTEILADIADASLLVIKQSTARTQDINDAIDILTGTNSELLGCVYNNVRNTAFGYKSGYGYGYSYKNYYGY